MNVEEIFNVLLKIYEFESNNYMNNLSRTPNIQEGHTDTTTT
jgi:hypothetical protein